MSNLKQGDIIEYGLNPYAGHGSVKVRRAVVVSGGAFNISSLVVALVPIQLIDDDHPMHVRLNDAGLQGSFCVEKMHMVNVEAMGFRKLGMASDMTMLMVMDVIREVFDFQLWVKR